jgi:hypothetical protein
MKHAQKCENMLNQNKNKIIETVEKLCVNLVTPVITLKMNALNNPKAECQTRF